MNKSIPLVCLLFMGFACVYAQSTTQRVDSLVGTLQQEIADTQKVRNLITISSLLWNAELERAEKYAEDAIKLSIENNYPYGEILGYYNKGVINRKQGNIDQARKFGYKALDLSIREENWHRAGTASNSLGTVYKISGAYDSAAVYLFQAIEYYEKANKLPQVANAYNNLGNVFFRQNKNDLAIEYYEKAREIYEKNNNKGNLAIALMNLGKAHQNDSISMQYFEQCITIHEQKNNQNGLAAVYINIGSKFKQKNKIKAAIPHYDKALKIAEKLGIKSKISIASNALGEIYQELNQTQKAITYFERALNFAEQSNFKRGEKSTYIQLAHLYAESKNYEKAYQNLHIAKSIGDSLVNKQSITISSELEAKYDSKQKEATLVQQALKIEQQKNARNRLLIIGSLLLLALTAIFQRYYYSQKRKKQATILELQKEKSAVENLRQLDQLKNKFFTNISHELKTPLTLIMSPLEEAVQKSNDPNLNLAFSNSKKLHKTVNEILDLAKLEISQLELQEKAVNVNKLIRRLFFSFQSLADQRKISLNFQSNLSKDLIALIDVEKFEKIINNLTSNAIKFSESRHDIQLLANQKTINNQPHLSFQIIDAGKGIQKEDIDKIFNRYYQGQLGKAVGGSGIGLALSKELALLFQGDLSVTSNSDKGSTFLLEFPLKVTAQRTNITLNETTTETTTIASPIEDNHHSTYQPILLHGKKPRILIVEDNPDMSDFLVRLLKPNFHCTTAFNGIEALNKLKYESFDLITSDVMMPEMDGFEFRNALNNQENSKYTPFVMLTARALEEDKLRGFKLGVDDFITKPFSSRELLARIKNLLENKQERDTFKQSSSSTKEPENVDSQLLIKAESIVLENIHDTNFSVPELAKKVGYSQRQLGRILKKLTGYSPVNFILELRLQKAFQLIQSQQFATVSEVRYEIGIESAAYFATKFKARFGKSPKEYLS